MSAMFPPSRVEPAVASATDKTTHIIKQFQYGVLYQENKQKHVLSTVGDSECYWHTQKIVGEQMHLLGMNVTGRCRQNRHKEMRCFLIVALFEWRKQTLFSVFAQQSTPTYMERLTFQIMDAKAVKGGCKTSFCQSVDMNS